MAKFSKGDRITDGNAVYVITDVDDGIYEWEFVSGKADPSHSEGGEIAWAENKMRLANSAPVRSTNAVVQNAINARRARNAEGGVFDLPEWNKIVKRQNDALHALADCSMMTRTLADKAKSESPSLASNLASEQLKYEGIIKSLRGVMGMR